MEPRLQIMLGKMESTLRGARRRRQLALCWTAATVAGLSVLLIQLFAGGDIRLMERVVLVIGLVAAGGVWVRESRRRFNLREVAAVVAREHPEVRYLLATTVEQEPDPISGKFGFLQMRVIEQALTHPDREQWEADGERKLSTASGAQLIALAAFLGTVWLGGNMMPGQGPARPGLGWLAEEITVTPGDTQVERGTGLVITARFGATPPAEATLVQLSASGKTKRQSLARQLADPVFGASLPEIAEDGRYHVEYGTKQTRDYKISVFDYPALTRADALLQFPEYTSHTNQTLRDTLRVSAVEGTRLTYTLQLNKPVVSARFIGKTETLALTVQTNASARLSDFTLTNSARYALELVDADGRTNKFPTEFSIVVLPDRPPEVKVVFPQGDQRVSSLEELVVEGQAKGGHGLLKYGIGYSVAGQEPQFVELGQTVPAASQRQFTNQIALEKLGVAVDQVVAYFAWADDHGPDGQVRRTFSDMFFAEVRPFEEIFRADQSGESESQNQNQGGSQGGNQSTRLAELQKQIVIATWKLQQEKPGAPGPRHP